MSLPLNLKDLSEKLQSNIPGNYRLDWAGTLKSPIRYKTNTTKETAKILNIIWSNAISKLTGCKYIEEAKYIRLNSDYLDDTNTFTIYHSGTIMIQGNSSLKWADRYIEKLYKIVQTEIEDQKSDMNKSGETSVLEPSFEVKGVCPLCDLEDDDEMMQCEIKTCNAWVHNRCEGLSELEARKVKPYYCKHCRSMYNLKITRNTISDTLPMSSTQPSSIIALDISNPDVINELSDINSQNNSSLTYLKKVHSNLENMNDEDSFHSPNSAITELKTLTKNIAEAFKEEIIQRERNNSVNASQSILAQDPNTPLKTNPANDDKIIDVQEEVSPSKLTPMKINESSRVYLSAEKKLQKSQNQNKSLNVRLQAVTTKLISTEGQLVKANREIDRLKICLQEKSKTLNDNVRSETQIESMNEELNNLKITKDRIKEMLNQKTKENKEIKDAQHQNELKIQDLNQLIGRNNLESFQKTDEIQNLTNIINVQNDEISRKSNEVDHLKGRLNNLLKKLKCKSSLHEIEGYCEFRDAEQITQLKLQYKKLQEENVALKNQTEFDETVKDKLDDLLNQADAKVNQLRKNEKELMKRNRELVRQIDREINNVGQVDNNAELLKEGYPVDTSTADSLPEYNTHRQVSNDESERKISTPVKKRKPSESDSNYGKKSVPLTNPVLKEMLYSLESQLKKFFNENSNNGTSNQNHIKNPTIYNHDPTNRRNRPICRFLTERGCNSERCIYYHPPNLTANDQTINPNRSLNQVPCKYYLRGVCQFGNQCYYHHPESD